MKSGLVLAVSLVLVAPALAQDTPPPADGGVRVGITYTPGVRSRLVLLPGTGLDSVRAVIQRDLDFSDRFEVLTLGPGAPGGGGGTVNYPLYRTLGADYGVEVAPSGSGVNVRLHDVRAGQVRQQQGYYLPPPSDPGFRMAVHAISDEVVRWATGTPGIAASRMLFISSKRVHRVDSDGANLTAISPAGETALSPAWSPDGQRIAYTRFGEGKGAIVVQRLDGSERRTVPTTESQLNYTAAFAPDGRTLAFSRSAEDGSTDIFTVNLAEMRCARRLTVGRFADNLSPSFAPDGRRVAFVSTRAGPPQVYSMSVEGTDQELLAPFDYGVSGSSNAPEWSPDGASVAFHREVNRSQQIFILDVGSRRVRQLTSSGRNEDPTWAPDGRHLAFVSDRSGRRQVWIIDIETGRVRQLMTPGETRLPAWSRRLVAGRP